jgi:hypothetical protein
MSLEYYLFYKHHYENIINNLDNIIDSQLNEQNTYFLLERKQHIIELKRTCENKILELLCKHEFEDDMIDITPERSQYITYCAICGYTK